MEISQLARDIQSALATTPTNFKLSKDEELEYIQLVLDKAEAVGGFDFAEYDDDDDEDDEDDDEEDDEESGYGPEEPLYDDDDEDEGTEP